MSDKLDDLAKLLVERENELYCNGPSTSTTKPIKPSSKDPPPEANPKHKDHDREYRPFVLRDKAMMLIRCFCNGLINGTIIFGFRMTRWEVRCMLLELASKYSDTEYVSKHKLDE